MDQIERLLGLYKGAETDSERRILLETVRISNPGEFPRLEDMIMRDRVRELTLEQLVQLIASHRRITLQQADELLRDAVCESLLDRASLKIEDTAWRAPTLESGPAPIVTVPVNSPPTAAPAVEATAAVMPHKGSAQDRPVEVMIIQDPGERESVPTVVGKVKPEKSQDREPSAPPAPTSFRRLQPRGIGG